MNLVQIANELEYVPKEQLAEMSQNPNSRFPQYLVISEIQRRTKNDKAYAAMKQQPTTTVAEEVVNEFVQPKGLQAGIPSGSAPTDVFSPESSGMPASAPMQMAASGGITGYNMGGPLSQSFTNPNANQDIPPEVLQEVQSVASSKGADFLKFAGVLKEDGSIDPLGATLAVASIVPIGRAAVWAGKAGYNIGKKFLPGALSGLKGLAQKPFTAPNPRLAKGLQQGQRKVKTEKGYKTIDTATGKEIKPLVFSPEKTLRTTTSVALPAAIVKNISDSAQEQYALDNAPETDAEREARLAEEAEAKRLADIQAARDKAAEGNITSLSDFVASKEKADRRRAGLDMAQLGGVILGSQNLTDLGKGITGIASNMQTRDAAEGMAGAQQAYYEAQTGKLQAETKALPATDLRKEIDTYAKILKTLVDQNDGSETSVAQITQVQGYINSLSERLATMQGYASADSEATRNQRLKASGISVT